MTGRIFLLAALALGACAAPVREPRSALLALAGTQLHVMRMGAGPRSSWSTAGRCWSTGTWWSTSPRWPGTTS